MGTMQVYVDNTALDNGSSRRIFGQFRVAEVMGQGIVLSCAVLIQAATVEALQELWASTKTAFQKRDVRVIFTLDTAADTPLEDVAPLDGRHQDVSCNIVIAEAKEQTATSLWLEFTCAATSSDAPKDGVDGQLGDFIITTVYDGARTVAVTARGIFRPVFDEDFVTGLTITSVTNSGGKAVFNVASGAPTFVAGMRLKVTGTANYQAPSQWHEVTGIVANAITTNTLYIANDTGTAQVGKMLTGLTNYVNHRSTLLTGKLLTDSDGTRNSSSELALTHESREVNDDDQTCAFILGSSWMEFEIADSGDGNAARTFDLEVTTTQPDDWQDAAGPRPLLINVKGAVTFDRAMLARTIKDADWLVIEAKVQTAVKNKVGQQDAKRLSLVVSTSGQSNVVSFQATYVAKNLTHLSYHLTVVESEQLVLHRYRDADGYHTVQKAPGKPDVVQTITVNRTGPGLVSIAPPNPTETLDGVPALFINSSRNRSKEGTYTMDEVTGVYTQTGTWTFDKFDLRPGASIQDLTSGVL